MPRAWINIGSNYPGRAALIERAASLIRRRIDPEARASQPFESEPWGFDSPLMFLNIGMELTTGLSPEELLDELLGIQHSISPAPHRAPDGSYIDRAIDIDLIAVEGVTRRTQTLTLPHPRAFMRPFVMEPLKNLLAMRQML